MNQYRKFNRIFCQCWRCTNMQKKFENFRHKFFLEFWIIFDYVKKTINNFIFSYNNFKIFEISVKLIFKIQNRKNIYQEKKVKFDQKNNFLLLNFFSKYILFFVLYMICINDLLKINYVWILYYFFQLFHKKSCLNIFFWKFRQKYLFVLNVVQNNKQKQTKKFWHQNYISKNKSSNLFTNDNQNVNEITQKMQIIEQMCLYIDYIKCHLTVQNL